MADRIKGLTVEIDGSTTGLDRALKSVNTTIKTTQAQLKDVQNLLKLDPSNTELLSQKQRLLKEAIGATKEKLESLKAAQEQAKQKLENGTLGQDKYDALQREIEETEQALKALESQVSSSYAALEKIDQTGKKFKEAGDSMAATGRTLTTRVTAPIVGLGAAVVKTTADFDAQMSKVQAISGAAGDELEALREKARKMGAKTKFSASEAGEAFEYMAMAGWKTGDMLEGIEGIMSLAAASGESLGTTSDIVTDALTAFGMSAKDSGHFADVLAAASSNANTNVSMLGESFKFAAPVAGALGITSEDTSIALGLMANAGIKATQSGTALRTGLTNLAKPTKQIKTYMEKYGVALAQNSDGSINLRETMISLRENLGGLSESEQAAAAAAIFGKNSMAGWLAVINATDQDFNKLTAAIDGCDGIAETMAGTMQDNLSGQLTIMKSQLEELAISFGDLLMPIVRKAVTGLQAFIDRLNGMSDSQRKTIIKVLALVAAIGPLLLITGKLISLTGSAMMGFAKLGKGIITLGSKIQSLGGVTGALGKAFSFLTSPVGLVIAAVAALAAAFIHLWRTNDDFREKVTAIWSRIKEIFSGFADGIKERLAGLGISFSDVTETLEKIWNGFCDLLAPVFIGAFDIIADVLETVLGVLTGLFDVFAGIFTGDWDRAWTGVKEIFSSVWDGIKNIFSSVLNTLRDVADTALGWFGTDWKTFWNGVKMFFVDLWNGIASFFTGVWNGIKTFIVKTLEKIGSDFSAAWNGMKAALTVALTLIQNNISTVWNAVKNLLSVTLDGIKTVFSKAWSAVKTTVTTVVTAIQTTVTNVWNAILTVVSAVMSGISTTVSNVWNAIKTTVSNVSGNIHTAVANAWNGIKMTVSTTMSGLGTSVSNVWNGIKTSISNAVNSVKTTVSNAFNAIKNTATSVWNSIKSAITGPIDSARSAVSSAIDRIKGLFNFSWSFPKLKMPHFSWTWKDIGGIVSIPMISVEWYRKAMDGGMILNSPTIFGAMNGQLLGAGEAGSEAVVGTQSLMDMIRRAVAGVETAMNVYYGGVTVNVYSREGQDISALADEIEERININMTRRKAAFI